LFEVGRLGTDQKRQLSARGGIRQSRHRRIDIDEAASSKLGREIKRVIV